MPCNANRNLEPLFLAHHIPVFFSRFKLFYHQDGTCISYYLYDSDGKTAVSKELVLSHDRFSRQLYVSRFYPEICHRMNARYLSAACFYMLVHHSAQTFSMPDGCGVTLETDSEVFDAFYSLLNDFSFKISFCRPGGKLCLKGQYHRFVFETGMITRCRNLTLHCSL